MAASNVKESFREVPGGVTAPRGFRAAGIHCGIKASGKRDLALIASDPPAAAAAVFTTNRVQAAPVILSGEIVRKGKISAIIANSGNANACTGEAGLRDAEEMAKLAAQALKVEEGSVLVASTGVIGYPLPMDSLRRGIPILAERLSVDGNDDAAEAILTTDTRVKITALEWEMDGRPVRMGGIAKGSGMIAPHMATMLAFITCDAAVGKNLLQEALCRAAAISFNKITVDGDTSTNDTVFCLANGASGAPLISTRDRRYRIFSHALERVSLNLAKMIVRDGEGATKLIEVRVMGAGNQDDAERVAKCIANSNLVKTALFGKDPNWGRILAAAGRSGVDINPDRVSIRFGEVKVAENGVAVSEGWKDRAAPVMEGDEIEVTVDLNMGEGSATVWTCDFSYDYVRINAEYHT